MVNAQPLFFWARYKDEMEQLYESTADDESVKLNLIVRSGIERDRAQEVLDKIGTVGRAGEEIGKKLIRKCMEAIEGRIEKKCRYEQRNKRDPWEGEIQIWASGRGRKPSYVVWIGCCVDWLDKKLCLVPWLWTNSRARSSDVVRLLKNERVELGDKEYWGNCVLLKKVFIEPTQDGVIDEDAYAREVALAFDPVISKLEKIVEIVDE